MPSAISQSLLPEFDHEMANTRKALERVPADQLTWAPHPRSMSLGRLATHVARMPAWGTLALTRDDVDLTAAFDRTDVSTSPELLDAFDQTMAEARRHLADTEDASWIQVWTFRKDGHLVMTMPRILAWRTFMMNHLVHHRGQLSVYLRLVGAAVPSFYGPSADER